MLNLYYQDIKKFYWTWWDSVEFRQELEQCNLPSPQDNESINKCLHDSALLVAFACDHFGRETGSYITNLEGLSHNFLWNMNKVYSNDEEFDYNYFLKSLIHCSLMLNNERYYFNFSKVKVDLLIFNNLNDLWFDNDELYFMLDFQINQLFQKKDDSNVNAYIEYFVKKSLDFMKIYQPHNYTNIESMKFSNDEIFKILSNQFQCLFQIKNESNVKEFFIHFVKESLNFMENYQPQNNEDDIVDIKFEQFISEIKSEIEHKRNQFSQLENIVITNELEYMQNEQMLSQIEVDLLDILCKIDDAYPEKEDKKEHLKQIIRLINALISKVQNKIQSLSNSNESTN